MRTRACDTSTSSGTIAPGRAKRARRIAFGTLAFAPRRRRRELDRARLVHDERERARICPRNSLARLVRHEPADPDAADGDAERDRCGSRRWRRRRWNRRLRRWRLRGGSRWRLGRLTRRARSGARGRGQPEGGGEAEKCAGDEERCADVCEPTLSRFQCRHEHRREYAWIVRHHCVDAGSVDPREIIGASTVHATTAAPRACAARTHALVTTEWWMTTALARVYASSGRTTDGVTRRSAPQPDASRPARRDPRRRCRRTLRGIVIPVRMSPSSVGDRASGSRGSTSSRTLLPARPCRRTAATTSRSRRVSLRSR